jgi:hypothetical protein
VANRESPYIESNFRKAFDLLLKIRQHERSTQILGQLVGYMRIVLRESDAESPPIIISVQAVRIRQR